MTTTPGPFYDHKGVAHDTMPIDEGTGLPLYRPAPAGQASKEAGAQQAAGSIDTPEFRRVIENCASQSRLVYAPKSFAALIAHIHAWAASRTAAEIAGLKRSISEYQQAAHEQAEASRTAATPAQPIEAQPVRDLSFVIQWLEGGCDPMEAAKELRLLQVAQPIAQPTELTADLINLLNAIRPNFGDVGTRDVDVAAQRRRIDSAIVSLGLIMAHDGREHPTPRPAQPIADMSAPTDEQIREGLPPLPTPICEKPASGPHFTAGQMQDYALTARAAAPVSGPTDA